MNTFDALTAESNWLKQADEFRKKYENCFITIVPDNGKPFVGYLRECHVGNSDRNTFYVFQARMEDKTDRVYKILHDTEVTLEARFPDPGFFTVGQYKRLFYFSRVPARQFRKAPCNDNCSFVDIERSFRTGNYYHTSISTDLINAAFNPVFVSLEEAVYFLTKTNCFGAALSPDWALHLDPATDSKLCLLYRGVPIGDVDAKAKKITILDRFNQEIHDYLHYSDQKGFEVKNV